ncbi:MAG: DNA-deoxyinosine glycosylase, partial [Erysipelotrichaceae bacterium]|nr:DNA-deoxyinosine glycosylase [Erysipelotrichaceae bacterium]
MPRIIGFDPIVFEDSRILILGSMPSVASVHQQMYYANPTNRFWPVLSAVTRHPVQSDREKLDCLKENQIALWDVCASCQRKGSLDAAIKEMAVNDIAGFLRNHPVI